MPPYICHVFTKHDKALKAILERNHVVIANMVKEGIVGNYSYVSSKTEDGINQLETALFDCKVWDSNVDLLVPEPFLSPDKKAKKSKVVEAPAPMP